ncbi:MAG: DsbA family protein [Solirubrobacterales bacterium]|nr:DsbA family protein [Solirubrobacterales bacterium]
MSIAVTHFTDPGCPWAYSAAPALRTLEWRFADQLEWELVVIGLTETAEQYERRGYTPERVVASRRVFAERFGMPCGYQIKSGVSGTSRACRAVMLAAEQSYTLGNAALAALQRLQFTTADRLDDDSAIARALDVIEGIDGAAVVACLDDDDVLERYESQRLRSRQAAGTPTEAQGKSATSDGPVRYTAPSLVFTAPDGRSLEAGGFQPIEAYDVVLANLDPKLERREPPSSVLDVISGFPQPLASAEIAAVMALPLVVPSIPDTVALLEELVVAGKVIREPLGEDALWHAA